MIVWPLRAVVLAAVVLAFMVARRAPQHRPIAIALGSCLALDCARALLPMPGPLKLGLSLVPHALSAWVAARVFWSPHPRPGKCNTVAQRLGVNGRMGRFLQVSALVTIVEIAAIADIEDPTLVREWLPPAALGLAVLAQVVLACVWGWRLRGASRPAQHPYRAAPAAPARPLTVAQACALVLLGGDVAGLLGPAGPLPWPRSWWWVAAAQAALVAVVLVGVQGSWLLRSTPDRS